ncbi:uncharacterized protein LOC114277948 [Camellia sinensis]|uniref:uncharacterized protein LOC114277948 n=1 Tax=Camellia sinensis TaxID=4442 RepID=UPI0010367721|nr:uncharacterized protein LOC114277948 [Camellia sinensis]
MGTESATGNAQPLMQDTQPHPKAYRIEESAEEANHVAPSKDSSANKNLKDGSKNGLLMLLSVFYVSDGFSDGVWGCFVGVLWFFIFMEFAVLLLCTFGQTNAVLRIHQAFTFKQLIDVVCDKFDIMERELVCLLFSIPGYNKFKVDSDDDFQNMFLLAKSFGLQHIDVIIQVRDNGSATQRGLPVSHDDGECETVDMRTADMEDRTDLLATYCPHRTKTYLSAGWAFGITHVGQIFPGGAHEFRTVLCKYAVECGFQFKYVKNDAIRVTAICKFVTSTACEWLVHARVSPSNGVMCLKRFISVHSCGAAVRTYRNPRTGSDLVSDVIAGRVREQPLTRPTDVVFDMKDGYGLDISYRVAWLGVEKARNEVFGDHAMSFDQLRWYSDAVMENNPHSYINLDFDQQTGRFVRYFIAFRACIDGFNGCRPLLFLDGTFLKGRFKGTLLAATAKDGNQGLFPLAFAIVDSENSSNWEWFLRHLAQVVDGGRNLTFVSDRNLGLIQSMPVVFPAAHHAFCLLHLQMNLRDRMKYVNADQKVGLMRKLRDCAYAPTVTSFNHKVEILKECSPVVVGNFLKDVHPQHWANAYFRGRRYGEMWSNAAESFNNWIREARHLPITQLVDAIRGKIMEKMSKRKVKASNWVGELCPKMEKRLMSEFQDSRHWIVSQSDDNIFEVRSQPSVLVDLANRSCSCFQWQLNGFPCPHAIVAFRNTGKNVYDYIEPFFHAVKYREAYEGSIHPIPTVAKPNFTPSDYLIAPPVYKRPPGRPKRKIIPSKGEVVQHIRCGRCRKMGHHNRKTCKEAM